MFRAKTVLWRSGAVFALAGLLLQSPVAGQTQTAPVTIRIAAAPFDDVMPVLYAQREGLFAKAGLNVVVQPMSSGAALQALGGGAVDIGKGGVVGIINAHAHNFALVLVAPAAIYDPRSPDAVLAATSTSPVTAARDLVGKTVGVPTLTDLSEIAVRIWLQNNGQDWRQTKFVELPVPSTMESMQQDRVQAAVLVKPFISIATGSGNFKVVAPVYSAIAPRFLESAWYANASFVQSHPAAIAAFARVVAQASAYTNAHPSDTIDLLVSFTGIDPQRAAHMPRIITGTTLDARDVQPIIDSMVKSGLLDKPFDAHEIIVR